MPGSEQPESLVWPISSGLSKKRCLSTIWANPSKSSARSLFQIPAVPMDPPNRPLPQFNFTESSTLSPRVVASTNPDTDSYGQMNSFAIGLGLTGVSVSDRFNNNANETNYNGRYNLSYQSSIPNELQASSLDGHTRTPVQDILGTRAIPFLPNMNFHTTAANFSSQNVLPQSQQVVGVSSATGYSTMVQDPQFCDSYQSQSQLIPPSPPIYPGPPVFADQYAFGYDEPVQYSGLYHFPNLHLQLDHFNPPYEQNHSGQMRRYSLGEKSISRSTSIAPNPSVKLAQMHEEVSRYFDSDPYKRETIHNGGMISGLEKGFGTVTAEFEPPSFGKQELRKLKLVLVKFKAGRLDVYYIHRDSKEFSRLRIGDLVIVEADRGSDLGKVAQIDISYDESRRLKMHNTLEKKFFFIGRGNYRQGGSQSQGFKTKGKNVHLQLDAPKAISSLANSKDTEAIYRKIRDEEKACQITINVISSMLFLGLRIQRGNKPTKFEGEDIGQMEIVDAEYQFDRKKLTIYFTSPKRVNFRDLLTELFKLFKARIWFEPVQSRSIPFRCLPHASNDSSDLTTFHVRSKSCESRKTLTSKNNGWRLSPRREAERRDWDFQQSPRFGCVEPNSSRMPKQRYSSKSQDAQVKASLDFLRQQNDFSASLPNAKRYGSNARISDKRCIG